MNYLNILPPIFDPKTVFDDVVVEVIKNYRNQQLRASDWTQLPDVDLVNKWDWAVYRQALRDMMAQNEDPKLIVFPEPPK
jgi:hypothetical protein